MEKDSLFTFLPSEEALHLMNEAKNIRNVQLLGHLDAGCSTVVGFVASNPLKYLPKTNHLPKGSTNVNVQTDSPYLIDYKNPIFPVQYNREGQSERYLINLMNNRNWTDRRLAQSDTSADSVVLLVDSVEGFGLHSEILLRDKILPQKLKPILFLNKLDRFFQYEKDGEKIYQQLVRIIEKANEVISCYPNSEDVADFTFDPLKGNVIFGSALHGWWFTLDSYARLWAQKYNLPKEKLWGENFHNKEANKWQTEPEAAERGFVRFILNPLAKIYQVLNEGDTSKVENALTKLDIKLTPEEAKLQPYQLRKIVFSRFLNSVDCLFEIIIEKLPSPYEAQKYRARIIYDAPEDDVCLRGIKECDPNGPLMISISRITPATDPKEFSSLGRVFSGTVRPGQKVHILDPHYQRGKKEYFVGKVGAVKLGTIEAKEGASAGNLVWISGLEKFVMQKGTITDYEDAQAFRLLGRRNDHYIKMEVEPKKPADLPKVYEILQQFNRIHAHGRVIKEETGKMKVTASDGYFLDEMRMHLKGKAESAKIEINISENRSEYREAITQKSSQVCTVSDDHNTFSAEACPILDKELISAIEKRGFNFKTEKLVEELKWDVQTAENLWAFGPESVGPNVLVNLAKSEGLDKIQEGFVSAFQWATSEGVLAGENMHGVRINILDATISADKSHRETSKILPVIRKLYLASELTAKPRLREPIFLAEVVAPQDKVYQVCKALERKGEIFEHIEKENGFTVIKAYVSAKESLEVQSEVRISTQGQGFPAFSFDHWREIDEDPFDTSSGVYQIVKSLRAQNGLKGDLPILSDFIVEMLKDS